MFGVASQKYHLMFAPVRYTKTEHGCIERGNTVEVGGVENDMTDGIRFDRTLPPFRSGRRDAGRNFDSAAVRIQELKTIPASRLVQRLWCVENRHVCIVQDSDGVIDCGLVGQPEGQMVNSFSLCRVQAEKIKLFG